MSLLSVCKAAARLLRVNVPSSLVNSNDETAELLLELAREEGISLMRRYPWQALMAEHTFTTTAADVQAEAIPTDFDRILPETMYNRTRRRFVGGPLSSGEWQQIKATLIVQVNPVFRVRGDELLISPEPPAGETVAYEYVKKTFCASAGGTAQADWAADDDVAILDEGLIKLGLIWRFRQAKGLSYEEEIQQYERRVADAEMRDGGGKPRLSADIGDRDRYPTRLQIPETLPVA